MLAFFQINPGNRMHLAGHPGLPGSVFKQIFIHQQYFSCMDFQHILDNLFITLNECRMHPGPTAQKMQELHNHYQGRIYKGKYKTREGTKALNDLIHDFSQRNPINRRLKWSFALHLVADEQATILGERGLVTTETTSNFKSLPNRVEGYAIVRGRLCEVYEFGGRTAQQILEQLLIDDGLVSRKRRNTLMDPIFNYIGIGTSYHEKHEACTVIVLAEDIISLVAPDASGRYKRRKGLKTGEEITVKLYEDVVMDKAFLGLLGGNQSNNPQRSQYAPSGSESSFLQRANPASHHIQPQNEPHFLLEESSIQPRSEVGPQRVTQESRNTFDEQAYLSRQKERTDSESIRSGQQSNTNVQPRNNIDYERDHRLTDNNPVGDLKYERDDLQIRDTTPEGRVPEPVATSQKPKKDSKCRLM